MLDCTKAKSIRDQRFGRDGQKAVQVPVPVAIPCRLVINERK